MARLCRHRDARGHDAVEGRGTTRPLELFGAPDLDTDAATAARGHDAAPRAAMARGLPDARVWFEPTFHKHVGKLCAGLQVHVDDPSYRHDGSSLALDGGGLQAVRTLRLLTTRCGATSPTSTARPAGHRPDQRQPAAAGVGRRRRAVAADLDALAQSDERDDWRQRSADLLLYR